MIRSAHGPNPWLNIPRFAQPGQRHAFVNRGHQLAKLYRLLANTGNAVRQGAQQSSTQVVVTGHMGAGKSALILQALYMLRGEHLREDSRGQRLAPGHFLPDPLDIQRWLILHVSGKRVADIDALAASLQTQAAAAGSETATSPMVTRDPYLGLSQMIHEQAATKLPAAPLLPIIHRLLSREPDIYHSVRTSLGKLAEAIEQNRRFAGGTRTEQQKLTETREDTRQTGVKADLEGGGALAASSAGGKASLTASGSQTRKRNVSESRVTELEQRSRVSSQALVQALNEFFGATRRAGLPTILVLDDFDEVPSSVGPSHLDRSRILASVLGTLTALEPTVLILGLRKEYLIDDIHRQYEVIHVPALARAALPDAISAWAELNEPMLPPAQATVLSQLADRFLASFAPDAACLMPYPFFQLVAWLANEAWGTGDSDVALLRRYLSEHHSYDTRPLLERLAGTMTDDEVIRCARAEALDAARFPLSAREIEVLTQEGLFRRAMAGDPDDSRIILDPLCAYLHRAMQAPAA